MHAAHATWPLSLHAPPSASPRSPTRVGRATVSIAIVSVVELEGEHRPAATRCSHATCELGWRGAWRGMGVWMGGVAWHGTLPMGVAWHGMGWAGVGWAGVEWQGECMAIGTSCGPSP